MGEKVGEETEGGEKEGVEGGTEGGRKEDKITLKNRRGNGRIYGEDCMCSREGRREGGRREGGHALTQSNLTLQ